MYVSIQTVCGCHGYLLFESIHCDRCRSLIPYQLSDESLIGPSSKSHASNGAHQHPPVTDKQTAVVPVTYEKQYKQVTNGRVRFRTSCPFCNSSIYVLRYYCKRERIYHHVRINTYGESDQNTYKSIAEIQNMHGKNRPSAKISHTTTTSTHDSIEDSYSLSGSLSQQPPSTILYDQSGLPTARDLQIETERNLYALNNLEGDLFNILRNGLFYDTLIQCQDNVKIQAHRCILGGRSNWFRNLLGEYHDSNGNDDYVLQLSIDDVQSDILNEVLNFIYTNRCLISLKNAPDLLVVAKRFELERLRKQIAEFLLSRLTVDNAIEMLVCAHEAGSETLKSACIRLINRHAEKIKRTEKWRTFKTEYVDLVPELYERRVERPAPQAQSYLPDVFSTAAVEDPPDNLRVLSQMYENPVKHRLVTPSPRILPAPSKQQNHPTTTVQQVPQHELRKEIKAAPQPPPPQSSHQRANNSRSPPVKDQRAPVKKKSTPNPRRQTVQAPPAAVTAQPLVRTVFPTIHEPSEVDMYRRPVNVYEKSAALPSNNQNFRSMYNQAPGRSSPPPPPSLYKGAEKTTRGGSPMRLIEIQRSPTLSSLPPEERMTLARVISVETME